MRHEIHGILDKTLRGLAATRIDLAAILPSLPAELADLMAVARIATSCGGTRHFTCGIVNAKSGQCGENCAFCAQSAHFATGAKNYPLVSQDELLFRADSFAARGVDYMGIVTSGGSPTPTDFDRICRAAATIGREIGIKLCASLGVIDAEKARSLKQAGFTSFHHNLETSRTYYPMICTTHEYGIREKTVKCAKAAGLRVCCGGIFGLGENWDHRLELSEALTALEVDSIPINFLTPIAGTPLATAPVLSPGEALAIIAAVRLMHPGRDVVVCGGRDRSFGRFSPLVFQAGANGIMVGDYLTTKGAALDADFEVMHALGLHAVS